MRQTFSLPHSIKILEQIPDATNTKPVLPVVVVAVHFAVVVVQFAVVCVTTSVWRTRPPVSVVAKVVELAIVVVAIAAGQSCLNSYCVCRTVLYSGQ